MNFNLPSIGPHWPPYMHLSIFILLILAASAIFILVSHYSECILIKTFIRKVKKIINNGNSSNLIKSICEIYDNKKDLSFNEKIFLKKRNNIYTIFRNEFIKLISIANRVDEKHQINSNLQLFYMRLKRKFSEKISNIKLVVLFSLLAELYAIVVGLNMIVKLDPFCGENGITFWIALMMIDEIVFPTGILLMIILFLSFLGFFIIKKKCNFLFDETDKMINNILKIKFKGDLSQNEN